jgi:hypothetical protein
MKTQKLESEARAMGFTPAAATLLGNFASATGRVTELQLRISRDVREENGAAEQRLRAKCQWEQMTRTAVIAEWGDPRTWDKPSFAND